MKAELLFNLQERWRDFAKNHFVAQTAPISFIISIKVPLNFVLSIPQDISLPHHTVLSAPIHSMHRPGISRLARASRAHGKTLKFQLWMLRSPSGTEIIFQWSYNTWIQTDIKPLLKQFKKIKLLRLIVSRKFMSFLLYFPIFTFLKWEFQSFSLLVNDRDYLDFIRYQLPYKAWKEIRFLFGVV